MYNISATFTCNMFMCVIIKYVCECEERDGAYLIDTFLIVVVVLE